MGDNTRARKALFLAAFAALSLATLLLLAFVVFFFLSTPAGARARGWMSEVWPGAEQPPHLQQPFALPGAGESPAAEAPEAQPLPTPAPIQTPEPTLEPVYQVIEKRPPEGSLVIAGLGVDQPVVPVAVNGVEWDLSGLGAQVGWLQTTGAHPGDDLAMVLIGHITLPPPGGYGPFLNLNSLKEGDEVLYRTEQDTYVYRVEGQEVVSPDQVEQLYRPDGSRLLLVTCTGYNALQRKYDQRLLVEAKLVRVEAAAESAVK